MADIKGDQFGLFESVPVSLNDSKHGFHPKVLAQVPIFVPTSNRQNYDTVWVPNGSLGGELHHLPGGVNLFRYGPGLNIFDEDTLIAILSLVYPQLLKECRLLKEKVNPNDIIIQNNITQINSLLLAIPCKFTVKDINNILGRCLSGDSYERTRYSVDRLSFQQFKVVTSDGKHSQKLNLFEPYEDQTQKSSGSSYSICFTPMLLFIAREFVMTNLEVRKQLSDIGKALYRYLLSQPRVFDVPLGSLIETLRLGLSDAEFKRALMGRKGRIGQLELLLSNNVLSKAEINGTGRKSPLILSVIR